MKKIILYLLITFFININCLLSDNRSKNYECFSETSVSGLFQNKKKFLKETDFFPHKTILNFTKSFSLLIERERNKSKVNEAKYQFKCLENKIKSMLSCAPMGLTNSYTVDFSFSTMRYRKSLITDYWLHGKGNEVDYVHIAHGYCYSID